MDKDSVLLVYRITNVFEAHLEPTEWKLTEAVLRILQGQLRFHLAGQYEGEYANAREMLLNP